MTQTASSSPRAAVSVRPLAIPARLARPRVRRRALRRRRRLLGALCLLTPSALILGTDLWRRWDQVATFDRVHLWGYLATCAFSVLFWAVLLYAAARRRGILRQLCAGVFAVCFVLLGGVQSAYQYHWNTYLCLDSQVYSQDPVEALLGYLPLSDPMVLLHLGGSLLAGLGMLMLARHTVRPRRIIRNIAPVGVPIVLYGMSLIPASYRVWQSSSPDTIYAHGYLSLVDEWLRKSEHAPYLRVQRRDPIPVPALHAHPPRPRNVLLIIQESLRYDISCHDPDTDPRPDEVPSCATPFSSRAAPHRFPLHEWRSNASTTAISISDLWSGVSSSESPAILMSVPLVWDYAHAAGYDAAYWTSQHVMFGSMRLYVQDLPLSQFAVATHLDPRADFDAGANDALLTERVLADWPELEEPFVAVVQYSNGHYPYVFDEAEAPFQPSEFNKAPEKNEHFLNFFRNVHYLSDKAVGHLIDGVRAMPSGQRTVILYTSDHAESFREHWQLGHTSSLYDDEIHVPGWIDAPPGVLTPQEEQVLREAEDQYVWHLDVLPTILDLIGVWDEPALQPFRQPMIGHPITRPERTLGPVPLNNCSWVWECAFRNWGMMQGSLKIEAREWDNEFHCFDLATDPDEQHNLGERACAPLPDLARARFGKMPRAEPPTRKDLLFGPPPPSASASAAPP